ncbi:MAG: hypothetical protein ACRCXC_09715 [Legionella sp.]
MGKLSEKYKQLETILLNYSDKCRIEHSGTEEYIRFEGLVGDAFKTMTDALRELGFYVEVRKQVLTLHLI